MEKIKLFEAFAGIGTQRMALRNIGVDFEVVGISEIDKYALKSYEAIHGLTKNFGDISKINPNDLPDFNLFTYSFPCQDLSMSGKQQGLVRGKTRSGLLYECEKIIEAKRPKYLLLENVKALVGNKFKHQFDKWLMYLESLGYTNYWKVLNAKDYGIPQSRERVFVVSILGEHEHYEFHKPIHLTKCVADYEDKNATRQAVSPLLLHYFDEKYFRPSLSNKGLLKLFDGVGFGYFDTSFEARRIYSTQGVTPTLTTKGSIPIFYEFGGTLTSLERWRLMGISDEDYFKAKNSGVSETQLAKQAGNAIVVNVLEAIFKNLFKD